VTLGSPLLTGKFLISINSIVEMQGSTIVRSVFVKDINFTLLLESTGNNMMNNYSAVLDNGAVINIIVF
jgi:hypothetical protein